MSRRTNPFEESQPGKKQRPLEHRDWLKLPDDTTRNILHRIGVSEVLGSANKVCKAWREICNHPDMWRVIDMRIHGKKLYYTGADVKMCMHAVDLSQGQVQDMYVVFGNRRLIEHMAESGRSSQLRRLHVAYYLYSIGLGDSWSKFFKRASFLEEFSLQLTYNLPEMALADASHHCPMLRRIEISTFLPEGKSFDDSAVCVYMDNVLDIAKGMTQLRHLKIAGYVIKKRHLKAILSGCTHLESLDLTGCSYGDIVCYDLMDQCIEQIEDMRFPSVSAPIYY